MTPRLFAKAGDVLYEKIMFKVKTALSKTNKGVFYGDFQQHHI
ncbi:hypothetical protein G3A_04990 [Bacillus sp. 17376]|nr:hypothetical protein G3A_04990 [Bacillus sp. 17376]